MELGHADLGDGVEVEVWSGGAVVVGSFYQSLLTGVMAQYLIDPDNAPAGRDLARALRLIDAGVP